MIHSYSYVKFIYSEKATKFCKISTLLLTVCTVVKSKVKLSQNFVAFSKYINFNFKCLRLILSFLGMGFPSAFQWSWGLGFPTAMQGNWTSVFATATKESSKLAILAGIRVVGDKVAFCDGAPSPIVVWAVTQNSYLKYKKKWLICIKISRWFLHNFCASNLSLFFRW